MSNIPQIGDVDIASALIGRPIRGVGSRLNVQAYGDAAGEQSQVSIISIAGAENSSTYSIRVRSTRPELSVDETVSFTTDGSATVAELRDGLIAALQAEPRLGFLIAGYATDTAAFTLTFAANVEAAITFPANPTTDLTVSNTAAGFTQYLYGQAAESVELAGVIDSKAIQNPTVLGGGTLVFTLTTNTNSQTSTTQLIRQYPDGSVDTDTLVVSSAASDAATIAAAVAAIEALYPEASVAITTADEVVTATFPAGEEVNVMVPTVNTSTLDTSVATTAAPEAAPLVLVVDDMATAPLESRTAATSVTGPVPGQAISCASESGSTVWRVDGSQRGLSSREVYTDASGVLYDAAASGRRLWPEAKWHGTSESNRHALEL